MAGTAHSSLEYPLEELARLLEVDFAGNPREVLSGLATLSSAAPGQLSFFHNARYFQALLDTRASAVIVHPDFVDKCPTNVLISRQPYLCFAKASRLFERRHKAAPEVHATAIVPASAQVDPTATLGPHVVLGENVRIGARVRIGANCSVGDDCEIGEDGVLHAGVNLYPGVTLGARAVVHSGVVIGADGFGFASDGVRQQKIAQLGGVRIGDDVEIGAGSSIDRGALDDTVIGDGVKIDNLVQIAHNVRIGDNTVICGCSAVAGSTKIGKNCTIAGGVGIINHLVIADGVTVTAMSLVSRSIDKEGVYSSGTGLSDTLTWRRNMVRFRELDSMSKRLRRLEQALEEALDKGLKNHSKKKQ